ncbi:unnamed protein product [Arctogadus glacialis]
MLILIGEMLNASNHAELVLRQRCSEQAAIITQHHLFPGPSSRPGPRCSCTDRLNVRSVGKGERKNYAIAFHLNEAHSYREGTPWFVRVLDHCWLQKLSEEADGHNSEGPERGPGARALSEGPERGPRARGPERGPSARAQSEGPGARARREGSERGPGARARSEGPARGPGARARSEGPLNSLSHGRG